MANPWPTNQNMENRLASLPSVVLPIVPEWNGKTYRFAQLKYSSQEKFTNGEGARQHGGRFTPIGAQRTLYSSLDIPTADAELEFCKNHNCLPYASFQRWEIAVSVKEILYLNDSKTLSHLGITFSQICEEWRVLSDENAVAPTQTFGKLVYEAGFEGILYPSVRRDVGCNLALFPDNYRDGSHALMLNSV